MAETRDDTLRALIGLIPPVRALREKLEESIHLETFMGTGDFAVKSFQALRESVAKITDDPYVEGLSISAPENANDKEKVSLVLLAASQLAAYLEGQTGLGGIGAAGGGGGERNIVVHKAPVIGNVNISDVSSEVAGKAVEMLNKAFEYAAKEEEEGEGEKEEGKE